MDSVIKVFFLIKVDFSAMTTPVRSSQVWRLPKVQRASSLTRKGWTDIKRWVFSREKCAIQMENILPNLNINRLCSAEKAVCTSVSGWCCCGGRKKQIPVFCVWVRFCSVQGWRPSSLRRSICCVLLPAHLDAASPGQQQHQKWHITSGRGGWSHGQSIAVWPAVSQT